MKYTCEVCSLGPSSEWALMAVGRPAEITGRGPRSPLTVRDLQGRDRRGPRSPHPLHFRLDQFTPNIAQPPVMVLTLGDHAHGERTMMNARK